MRKVSQASDLSQSNRSLRIWTWHAYYSTKLIYKAQVKLLVTVNNNNNNNTM